MDTATSACHHPAHRLAVLPVHPVIIENGIVIYGRLLFLDCSTRSSMALREAVRGVHTIRANCVQPGRIDPYRSYSHWRWHPDEVFVRINGEAHYLWRAVDQEGEVLEAFVTKKRDRKAALRFLKKEMKRYGRPEVVVTDRLRSYRAAMKGIGNAQRQETGRWLNNRAENSHQLSGPHQVVQVEC